MKRTRINCFLVIVMTVLGIQAVGLVEAYAGEVGQVKTETGVGFYEESTNDSSKETEPQIPSKPTKKTYPATGERIRKHFLIGGIVLIVLAAVFFWLRRKRKE